jgi:hypothetical protein
MAIGRRVDPDMPHGVVNLSQIKLFHHFDRHTRYTLLLTPETWEWALQLALEHEFVMSGILCIAARHLSVLRPEDASYSTTSAKFFSRTLSLFCQNMPNPSDTSIGAHEVDALIATSLLLYAYVWASTHLCYSPAAVQDGQEVHHGDGAKAEQQRQQQQQQQQQYQAGGSKDHLWIFASSFKQVLLKVMQLKTSGCIPHPSTTSFIPEQPDGTPTHSLFMPQMLAHCQGPLLAAARISQTTLENWRAFFAYDRPITLATLDSHPPIRRCPRGDDGDLAPAIQWATAEERPPKAGPPDRVLDGYVPAIAHLCLLQAFMPDADSPHQQQQQQQQQQQEQRRQEQSSPSSATASATATSFPSSFSSTPTIVEEEPEAHNHLLQGLPHPTMPDDNPSSAPSFPTALALELATAVATFPLCNHGPYASLVHDDDPHALLLLYHYYRAAARLLPASGCWWALHRAQASQRALRTKLARELESETGAGAGAGCGAYYG